MELWHRACLDAKRLPVIADAVFVASPPPSRRNHRMIAGVVASTAALVVVAVVQWTWAATRPAPARAMPNVDVSIVETPAVSGHASAKETVPPAPERIVTKDSDRFAVPDASDGKPLDEVYYTLRGWTFPIVGVDELMPTNQQRWFGAERKEIERSDCGAGHCGVDLHGPRGTAIVAVAAGVLVKVERRFDGGDGMSGRYVRIHHEDGSYSVYMHLDRVVEKLEVGDAVDQGQYLGDLGSTGVSSHTPHLHFALELPIKLGATDVHTQTTYVNPAPFLVRSKVVDGAERKHAVRPAF